MPFRLDSRSGKCFRQILETAIGKADRKPYMNVEHHLILLTIKIFNKQSHCHVLIIKASWNLSDAIFVKGNTVKIG